MWQLKLLTGYILSQKLASLKNFETKRWRRIKTKFVGLSVGDSIDAWWRDSKIYFIEQSTNSFWAKHFCSFLHRAYCSYIRHGSAHFQFSAMLQGTGEGVYIEMIWSHCCLFASNENVGDRLCAGWIKMLRSRQQELRNIRCWKNTYGMSWSTTMVRWASVTWKNERMFWITQAIFIFPTDHNFRDSSSLFDNWELPLSPIFVLLTYLLELVNQLIMDYF